jgi:hypothetical protein
LLLLKANNNQIVANLTPNRNEENKPDMMRTATYNLSLAAKNTILSPHPLLSSKTTY